MKRVARFRHRFEFQYPTLSGEKQTIPMDAKVFTGWQRVELELTAEDVRNAIKAHGVGNTQNCAMAMCAKRLRHRFPHEFVGIIDWQYSRAFVASKIDKDGKISECVRYRHSDGIAKLNDSEKGHQKLLREIKKAGGSITIVLSADQIRPPSIGKRMGRKDGSRSSSLIMGVGAKRRFAVAFGGRVA